MALATPELFADGRCGKPLPAGELLQLFKFGQFCPVKVLDGPSEALVVVGRQQGSTGGGSTGGGSNPTAVPLMVPAVGGVTGASSGGFTFKQLLDEESSLQQQSAPAQVALERREVARTIATGEVVTPDGRFFLDLSPTTVAGLLDGSSVEVPGRSDGTARNLLLAPKDSLVRHEAVTPSVTEFEVPEHELAAYLTDPWLPGEDELPLDVKLHLDNVEELVRYGTTVIDVNDAQVGIKVTKNPADLNKIPFGKHQYGGGKYADARPGKGTYQLDSDGSKTQESYQPRRLLRADDFKGVMLAVYFEWNQEWILKGFSRGRLLKSLALAPQEETTIELFTWDRRKRTLEQFSVTETEQSMEDEEKTQDTTEVYRELTKKDEFEWKVGGELDAQYNGGTVNIKLKANASAQDKTNAEDIAKNTTKSVSEGVRKAAVKVRTQRSSKVTETTEIGSEERITRRVRNPNLCHTLNLDYFEITTHYDITTSFNEDAMRFCAMIRNPVAREAFPPAYIRQNEGPLRDALLDRSLAAGFDALRLLRAREVAVAALEDRKRRREREPLQASPSPQDKPAVQAEVSAEESAADNYLATLQAASKKIFAESTHAGLTRVFYSLAGDRPDLKTRKGSPQPSDLDLGKRWLAQQLFLRYYSQLSQVLGELAGSTGALSIRTWGPKLAPIMPSASAMPRPSQLNLEPQEAKQGLLVPALYSPPSVDHVRGIQNWDWWWGEIRRVGLFHAEDAGLGALVEQFEKVYRAFLESQARKSAVEEGAKLVEKAQQAQDQLSDEDRLEADFPMRDFAMATERAEVLRKHLEEHHDHYSFALFRALPPQEQLDHIEAAVAGINTGFEPGFFQPRVVSQIGSMLLVPLNHEVIPNASALLATLKARIDVPASKETVLLPSPGMTMEARLGQCSAGEDFVEETRRLELETRRAEVRRAEAEAKRLEQRLAAGRLEEPTSQVPRLQVDLERPPAPSP